jgi:Phosphotransferase enzyme family
MTRAARPGDDMTRLQAGPNWHGWIAAVIPSGARRFRVVDAEIGAILSRGGAEIVNDAADVEIGPMDSIRGQAPVAIVRIGPVVGEGDEVLPRVLHRMQAYTQARSGVRRARGTLRALGFHSTAVVMWDIEQHLRLQSPDGNPCRIDRPLRLAERFPGAALVIGWRSRPSPTVLEHAARAAAEIVGKPALDLGCLMVRASGVLVSLSSRLVLKVAIGPGRKEIDRHRAGLELVSSLGPGPAVSTRLPQLHGHGQAGLATWSLEDRMAGQEPAGLSDRLLGDCLEFLIELHASRRRPAPDERLGSSARVVATLCHNDRRSALMKLADELERDLHGVQRGIAHGDFWNGNLLVRGGELVGVVDWAASAQGQLPLLDLMNLLVAERTRRYFGRAVLTYLLPCAREGGDELMRTYCERLGLELSPLQLEALAVAWWLQRVAREHQIYGDRARRPVWVQENVTSVLEALLARSARPSR